MHRRVKFRGDRSNRRRHMAIFYFQDDDRRHLGFLKFHIFNGRTALESRTASVCQISSKSVKMWLRFDGFSNFQDGGRRHLGFLKFHIFNSRTVKRVETVALPNLVEIG